MKTIARNKSIVTGGRRLEHLVTYKKYPVFIGCTDQPRKRDLLADMSFSICKDSGIVQLDKLIPPEVLYAEYHSEAVGGLWKEHHQEFVKFLRKFAPKNVLEIGGSNCVMAEQYLSKARGTRWTIVEPNPVPSKNPNIKIIHKFFNEQFKTKEKIDAVVHTHVIEHMHDPDAFLRNVSNLVPDGTLQIFAAPNLERYLKLGWSNVVNFEHTIWLTEYFIDYFLAKNGFKIIKKNYFYDHAIFYATRKVATKKAPKLISHYRQYKKAFTTYVTNYRKIVSGLNRKMQKAPGNVYLFGAHVFSQSLINLGLNIKKIKFILDNSKLKQGKRLYGTDLVVQSPEVLRGGEQRPVIILRVGAYKKEIKEQILRINDTAIFIE